MIVADGITPDFGFQCGPQFKTTVTNLLNGREVRNVDWSVARHAANAQFSSLDPSQFLYLKDLFMQCRGMAYTFLFRDWSDFKAQDAQFGTGDGVTKAFQLSKTSSLPGGTPYQRIIRAPDAGVVVKVAGVVTAATVSGVDGSVVFATAPANGAALTWTGAYHLVMRFNNDALTATVQQAFDQSGNACVSGEIDLIECFEPVS